ncbi:MAG: glycerol-3-phosphate 1-O-acyltransferase PlsY [Selenomonadaceae bacterium]|nr:glycerol-3-phosphate 1-O-acyltransferase PlsY [Selenomonadaceae bacterium]
MLVLTLILAYLLGSIPSGLIVGKAIWHKDLRHYGSGNIGATNAYRVLGRKGGALVFLLDFLKGELSVLLASLLVATPTSIILAGFFAIVGHMHSIFLQMKGGKGVATALGVISILMPKVAVIIVLVWGAIVFATRYVSLGSITAALMTPILAIAFSYEKMYVIFSIVAAAFIIIKHKDNIARIRKGRENRF